MRLVSPLTFDQFFSSWADSYGLDPARRSRLRVLAERLWVAYKRVIHRAVTGAHPGCVDDTGRAEVSRVFRYRALIAACGHAGFYLPDDEDYDDAPEFDNAERLVLAGESLNRLDRIFLADLCGNDLYEQAFRAAGVWLLSQK